MEWANDLTQLAGIMTASVAELPGYLVDTSKRIYWGYLLGALLLAIPVYLRLGHAFARHVSSHPAASCQSDKRGICAPSRPKMQEEQGAQGANQYSGVSGFFRFVFPRAVYLSASARMDYQLLVVNKLLKGLLFAPLVLTMVPVAMGVSDALSWLLGDIAPLSPHVVVVMTTFTALLFILDDATRFVLHWLLHKVPVLWAFHRVHHSADVLTPLTIYRTHPLESYLYACRMGLAQGIAVGLGYFLFGPALKMYDVLGANLVVFLFNVLGANLRHSHIWLPWGDKLEGWFISPAQHQIHHSVAPEHRDTNLGSALALWDRLAGSLIKSSQVVPFSQRGGHRVDDRVDGNHAAVPGAAYMPLPIGVGGYPGHDSLCGVYLNPLRDAMMILSRKGRIWPQYLLLRLRQRMARRQPDSD
ncbi:hypothetical protein NFHSH190041_07380 [Shewanella sp. NFH-SH190041]|uniref:sterol desaturase family protein n=1 Tax=Shewanella sp. NFH-SH190041 TaxID=2950245 RepID=UPI0021C31D2B|nr:sterol desaturase family protein [Shewanella sp. NFH-SH190041]BDM63286.1 hypothetical protein NFHSH190041_07380 [Shewanella sp. NFH-SH190041]